MATKSRAVLQEALNDTNVKAFLRLLRAGESSQDGDAYRLLVGGKYFNSLDNHPNLRVYVAYINDFSTAAGAYQFLYRTWQGLVAQYGFPDFSPQCQDENAVALILEKNAVDDIKAGRINLAINKCRNVWASLPASNLGQPTAKLSKLLSVYKQYGGKLDNETMQPDTPQPSEAPVFTSPDAQNLPQQTNKGTGMGPLIPLAIEALGAFIPQIAQLFGSGSDVQKRNVAGMVTAVNIAKQAVGAYNEQDLIDKVKSDPVAQAAAKETIEANWFKIHQATEKSIADARAFAVSYRGEATIGQGITFVQLLSLIFVAVSSAGAFMVLTMDKFPAEIKGAVVTLVLIGGFTGVKEFWFGTSAGSQRKTEAMLQQKSE